MAVEWRFHVRQSRPCKESVCVAALARLARGSVQEAESRGRARQRQSRADLRIAKCEVKLFSIVDTRGRIDKKHARRQAVFSRKSASIGCSMNYVGPASTLWPAFSIDATRERTMYP